LLTQTITGKLTNGDVDLSLTDQLAIALDAGELGDAGSAAIAILLLWTYCGYSPPVVPFHD
jgi:hypothetical protein